MPVKIDDGWKEYRCPKCKVLIGALTKENLEKAIKNHKCKVKK